MIRPLTNKCIVSLFAISAMTSCGKGQSLEDNLKSNAYKECNNSQISARSNSQQSSVEIRDKAGNRIFYYQEIYINGGQDTLKSIFGKDLVSAFDSSSEGVEVDKNKMNQILNDLEKDKHVKENLRLSVPSTLRYAIDLVRRKIKSS